MFKIKPILNIHTMSLKEVHDHAEELVSSFGSKDYNIVTCDQLEFERALSIREAIEHLDSDLEMMRKLYDRIDYEIKYLENLRRLEDE